MTIQERKIKLIDGYTNIEENKTIYRNFINAQDKSTWKSYWEVHYF